ncbi:hypothetical protein Mapa_012213 [Marchantia paleacea]|nr:hypothetical protein Mapa_012213 [Marchantia paleacea]
MSWARLNTESNTNFLILATESNSAILTVTLFRCFTSDICKNDHFSVRGQDVVRLNLPYISIWNINFTSLPPIQFQV